MNRKMIMSVAAGLFVGALSLTPAYANFAINKPVNKCDTPAFQNQQKARVNTTSTGTNGNVDESSTNHKVPEPASLILMGLGAGALALSRLRKHELD